MTFGRRVVGMTSALIAAMLLGGLFASTLAFNQETQLGPFAPWDLSQVEEKLHDPLLALQAENYKQAQILLKGLRKLPRDQRPDKSSLKLSKFLEARAKELASAQKLVASQKFKLKGLYQLRDFARRSNRTFLYPYYQRLENQYRKLGVATITDFEPPFESLRPIAGPLDPTESYEFQTSAKINKEGFPYTSREDVAVQQGLFALHWRDKPEDRNSAAPYPCRTKDWRGMRWLCFRAKLVNPKNASMDVLLRTNDSAAAYLKLGVGSWKGWRDFRVDFRKKFVRRVDGFNKIDWNQIDYIQFSTKGGLSDLYVDDVFLTK